MCRGAALQPIGIHPRNELLQSHNLILGAHALRRLGGHDSREQEHHDERDQGRNDEQPHGVKMSPQPSSCAATNGSAVNSTPAST